MNLSLVSIIVATRNEEKNIGNCLTSIKEQTYPKDKIEIIVVDNYSTDKTLSIVKTFKLSNLRTYSKGPERSVQRNYGIRKAKGEYILFLDADMSLSPKVVEECINKFKDPSKISDEILQGKQSSKFKVKLVGLYIPERILGNSYWCKVRDFERSFYNATVIDGLRFIRRKTFLDIGGFDERLYACEDWDLDKRLKKEGPVDIISNSLFHNEQNFSFKKYLNKKSYYSKNFGKYQNKWGANDSDLKKQFGIYYRYVGVFIENGKWKKILKDPVLASSIYFLKLLVGINYLKNK